jgi:hypothetical protein
MKRIALFGLALGLFAQTGSVTFTEPVPPRPAIPGKLVASTASGVQCTLTGDAVPATAITIACQVGSVVIQPYVVAFQPGMAYVFQHGLNADALTVMLSMPAAGGPIAVQATVNGQTPVSGTF